MNIRNSGGVYCADDDAALTDSEWAWIAPMLHESGREAVRGYLDDRIRERVIEAWERGNNAGLTFAAAPQKSLLANPYRVIPPGKGDAS